MKRVLSYLRAQHMALLALFFALGGTSFAAASTLVPANSVGTRQVINGSLQTSDLGRTARKALKGNPGPRGLTGATGPQGVRGVPGEAATKLFVAMNADGTLTKNGGATSATRAGAGVYRISFEADITNCVYLATGGQDAGGGQVEDYHLYTSRTGSNTVNVEVFDEKNSPFDRPFYLAVLC